LRQVIHEPVAQPSMVDGAIDKDLAFVCLKCLKKDPQRRYDTALSLARDLERWLQGDPPESRPQRLPEKCWRWCKRNPILASLLVGLFLLLATVAVLSARLYQAEKKRVMEMKGVLLDQIEEAYRAAGPDPFKSVKFSPQGLAKLTGRALRPSDVLVSFGLQSVILQPDLLLERITPFFNYFQANVAVEPGLSLVPGVSFYTSLLGLTQGLFAAEVQVMRADPAAYVLARQRTSRVTPLVQQVFSGKPAGPPAAIFMRGDSPIEALEQLKGRAMAIAFGERESAAGDYLPKSALVEAGLRRTDFLRSSNLSSKVVIAAVCGGAFDVGVADLEDISNLTNSPSLKVRLKILRELPCPSAPWVATERTARDVADAVKNGLLSLRETNVLVHLDHRLIGFRTVRPSDYDELEQQMKRAREFDQPRAGQGEGPPR